MSAPTPNARPSLASFVVPVLLVVVVALGGWLLLLFVKGIVVLAMYAVGGLLIVVPLLTARRLVGDRVGRRRWERIGGIVSAVALGVALIAIARLVSHHGWLLIVVPAVVVAVSRAMTAAAARRRPA